MWLILNFGLEIILFYYEVSGFGKCEPPFKSGMENNSHAYFIIYTLGKKSSLVLVFTSHLDFLGPMKDRREYKKTMIKTFFVHGYSGEFPKVPSN